MLCLDITSHSRSSQSGNLIIYKEQLINEHLTRSEASYVVTILMDLYMEIQEKYKFMGHIYFHY